MGVTTALPGCCWESHQRPCGTWEGTPWRRYAELPLSHLVEPITERPMSLDCGLGVEQGILNPAGQMGVCPFLQRFLFGTGVPATPGVWGRPSGRAAGQRGRCLQVVVSAVAARGSPDTAWRRLHTRGMRIAGDRFAKSRKRKCGKGSW